MRDAGSSVIRTPDRTASQVIDPKKTTDTIPVNSRVDAALRPAGSRNAGTALDTVPIPVRAVVPEEKDLATRKINANAVSDSASTICQSALGALSSSPMMIRMIAVVITTMMARMKA